jgi:3-hydroxyisobutyrate dehydrogenase
MPHVAFLGLGRMGRPMASRLLDAGHQLTVYNRDARKTADLTAAGATSAATPREAAESLRGSDAAAVIVMVSDDQASRDVWTGPNGLLTADLPAGTLAIECSTLSRAWVLELAVAVRNHRLRFVDAPVTGVPSSAALGELTFLVGADSADLAELERLLSPAGDLVHFGPVGAGATYKLMVNLMGAVQIAATAEGLAFAERAGLDLRTVCRALATGQAASPQVVRNSVRMAEDDHGDPIAFTGHLRHKDTDYAVRLADELDLAIPLGRTALRGLQHLIELGLGDRNESAIIEVAREPASARSPGWSQ